MKITGYRNLTTGEIAPPHRIGTDEEGRALYRRVDGWEPVEAYACDAEGNWLARRVAITVYAGQREDCGCEISEAEWDAYLALVRAEVAAVYNCAESDVAVIARDVTGRQRRIIGGFVDGEPDQALDEIVDRVWDRGAFWRTTTSASIGERGNGWPQVGDYVSDGDDVYRVVAMGMRILTSGSMTGGGNLCTGYTLEPASWDDVAEDDVYPCHVYLDEREPQS